MVCETLIFYDFKEFMDDNKIYIIKTKKDKEYKGVLWTFKPEENCFSIKDKSAIITFSFDDIKSAETENKNHKEFENLIETARLELKIGRQNKWFKTHIPIKKWENITNETKI